MPPKWFRECFHETICCHHNLVPYPSTNDRGCFVHTFEVSSLAKQEVLRSPYISSSICTDYTLKAKYFYRLMIYYLGLIMHILL